jgi:hypothetical protein
MSLQDFENLRQLVEKARLESQLVQAADKLNNLQRQKATKDSVIARYCFPITLPRPRPVPKPSYQTIMYPTRTTTPPGYPQPQNLKSLVGQKRKACGTPSSESSEEDLFMSLFGGEKEEPPKKHQAVSNGNLTVPVPSHLSARPAVRLPPNPASNSAHISRQAIGLLQNVGNVLDFLQRTQSAVPPPPQHHNLGNVLNVLHRTQSAVGPPPSVPRGPRAQTDLSPHPMFHPGNAVNMRPTRSFDPRLDPQRTSRARGRGRGNRFQRGRGNRYM